jgi:hypothetical protein
MKRAVKKEPAKEGEEAICLHNTLRKVLPTVVCQTFFFYHNLSLSLSFATSSFEPNKESNKEALSPFSIGPFQAP